MLGLKTGVILTHSKQLIIYNNDLIIKTMKQARVNQSRLLNEY